jgi:hypothetical protein
MRSKETPAIRWCARGAFPPGLRVRLLVSPTYPGRLSRVSRQTSVSKRYLEFGGYCQVSDRTGLPDNLTPRRGRAKAQRMSRHPSSSNFCRKAEAAAPARVQPIAMVPSGSLRGRPVPLLRQRNGAFSFMINMNSQKFCIWRSTRKKRALQ